MAEVTRRVCDLDQREDGVVTVVATVGNKTRAMDVCKRCYRDITIKYILENGGARVSRVGRKTFTKTPIKAP